MNTLAPSAPVTLDRSALLAALTVKGIVHTPRGFVWKSTATTSATFSRPFACSPHTGLTTWHASPALAIARLANL